MVAMASSPLGQRSGVPHSACAVSGASFAQWPEVSHCKPLSGVFGRCAGVNDVRERVRAKVRFACVRDRKWA